MEINANRYLDLYLFNPGDEVFAPMNVWPIRPQKVRLNKKNEFMQIRVTKESKLSKKNCNQSRTYVYGGKHFLHKLIFSL